MSRWQGAVNRRKHAMEARQINAKLRHQSRQPSNIVEQRSRLEQLARALRLNYAAVDVTLIPYYRE